MRPAFVITALALTVLGCGNSTSNPIAPGATTPKWTLSGTVHGNGVVLNAAAAAVMRQPLPILVTQTTTNGGGRYSLPSIDESSYFVQAAAAGYATEIMPVSLTSSKTIDFDLPLAVR